MPSKSKAQHNLMAMVANNPAAAKRVGIPQSVGEEYMQADKGKKFGTGSRPDRQRINKPKTEPVTAWHRPATPCIAHP